MFVVDSVFVPGFTSLLLIPVVGVAPAVALSTFVVIQVGADDALIVSTEPAEPGATAAALFEAFPTKMLFCASGIVVPEGRTTLPKNVVVVGPVADPMFVLPAMFVVDGPLAPPPSGSL